MLNLIPFKHLGKQETLNTTKANRLTVIKDKHLWKYFKMRIIIIYQVYIQTKIGMRYVDMYVSYCTNIV